MMITATDIFVCNLFVRLRVEIKKYIHFEVGQVESLEFPHEKITNFFTLFYDFIFLVLITLITWCNERQNQNSRMPTFVHID